MTFNFEEVRENLERVVSGPEGFVYASMFELLGLPVRNIHIDEYCRTEDRPYKDLKTTQIYTHVANKDIKRLAELL